MKKTIVTILCMAVFAVLAVSCQKEIDGIEPVVNTKETIEISINGLMGEYTQVDATKSSLVNTVRVSWEKGDVVYVYDGAQCLGSLVASLDENGDDRYAILSTDETHTVTVPSAGTRLTLVHSPLLAEAPAVIDGAISISLANQNGTKAPFVTYATLDYNNEDSINNALVPFKFATSVIKVNCTGLFADTAIDSAALSNVNTTCNLTLSGTAAPTVSGGTNGTITRTGDAYFAAEKVNEEGVAVFLIAVPVLEKASEPRVLTISQGSTDFKYMRFSKKSLEAATSVNTVCQFSAIPNGALSGKFSVSDGKQVYFSKGNLWADATDPENPVFSFEKNQYDYQTSWNTSHINLFYWSKSAKEAVKGEFNWDQERSDADDIFTNAAEDVAKSDFTVNGVTGKYRTLSIGEWAYLVSSRAVNGGTGAGHSYSLEVIYCGKIGMVLYPDDYTGSALSGTVDTLPEGVVFLPCAGDRHFVDDGVKINNLPSANNSGIGWYWSSSVYIDPIVERDPERTEFVGRQANEVLFHGIIRYDQPQTRDYGYSIRLVRDVTKN